MDKDMDNYAYFPKSNWTILLLCLFLCRPDTEHRLWQDRLLSQKKGSFPHPDLTKGDIRTYILSHLQFSVSEQAVLLGISPASVTKARQRLKAKLQIEFLYD